MRLSIHGLYSTIDNLNVYENHMKTLTAEECMEILHCERSRFLELVRVGDIPGAKIGRTWVFLEEDIYSYLKSEIAKQQEFCAEKKRVMAKAVMNTASIDELGILIRRRRRR